MKRIENVYRRVRRKLGIKYVLISFSIAITFWFLFICVPTCDDQLTRVNLLSSRSSKSGDVALESWEIPDWVRRYNVSHLFNWTWHNNGEFHRCQTSSNVLKQSSACRTDSVTVVNDALDYFHLYPDEGCIVDSVASILSLLPHPVPRSRSLSDTCSSLHIDRSWIFCRKSQSELNQLGSSPRRFITVAVFNAFVDPGSCHPDVPGTVFTHRATYHLQRWTAKYCCNDPITSIPKIDARYQHIELIDSIGNYLAAPGHFGPEQLPRLLRLLATAPITAKVLVAKGGIADAFVDILVERGIVTRDRIVPYEKNAHIHHFASIVYRSESWPRLKGGDDSYHVYDRTNVELVRRVLSGDQQSIANKQDHIIFIKRNDGRARSIVEHFNMIELMTTALNSSDLLSKFRIKVFEAQGHLRDHIALFRQARVIVGPHGAGMMNVLWSVPGTHVVEVGYNSGMTFPEMYAVMSLNLGHRHWVCKGRGEYDKPIHVDMEDFSYIFNQIIEELKAEFE